MAQTPCNNPHSHPVMCSPLLQVCHLVSWMLGPIYWALGGPTKYKLLRPPLSKKSFPVGRVGGEMTVGRSGFFFFFLISIFVKLECTGGKVKKKKKLKSFSRPFLAHPAGGQETIFYLRMAYTIWVYCLVVMTGHTRQALLYSNGQGACGTMTLQGRGDRVWSIQSHSLNITTYSTTCHQRDRACFNLI